MLKTVQAVVNGATTKLALNEETGKWEATLVAPMRSSYTQDGHYYDVTVTALDEAGNSTTANSKDEALGESLRLTVIERDPPETEMLKPTDQSLMTNNQPTFKFKVMDGDSGVDYDRITLVIDGTEVTDGIEKEPTSGGFTCTYTPTEPLRDGAHTAFAKATDHDGNEGQGKPISFKVDTIPPELSVVNPTDGLQTNKGVATVDGTTNDETSSPVTLTVNGEDVTVHEDGTFSTEVSLEEGENTITIVATDGAGRSTTVIRQVVKDTVPPKIGNVTLAPNPADVGMTYVISVDVTD